MQTEEKELTDGPMSKSSANDMLDTWHMQIKKATMATKALHEDAPSIRLWEAAILELKNQLDYARGSSNLD
jgi:hypothetical protein